MTGSQKVEGSNPSSSTIVDNRKNPCSFRCSTISTSGTDFYIYYGNPGANSISNGSNTWDFFDDFLGDAVDTNKWDEIGAPETSGNTTVANSELTINMTIQYGSPGINHGYKTKDTFDNCRIITKVKTGYSHTASAAIMLAQYNGSHRCANKIVMQKENEIRLKGDKRDCGGSVTHDATNSDFTLDEYYTYYYARQGVDHIKAWEDGVPKAIVTSNIVDDDIPAAIFLLFWNNQKRTQNVIVDWFAVGKYCYPEPTLGDWE